MTRFSISIPIGAWHDLLPTCLASLASQGDGVEISLLDASGDERVRAIADRHDDILTYRRHGPDKGQSDAILEGWRHTGGEILGWLNADDFLFPGAIKKARAVFDSEPAVDVIAGHSAICDEKGRMTGYHWAVEPPGENLRSGCVISQPSCFFRRSAYDKAGGLDVDLHYAMDWDLWLRLLESGAQFRFIDEILSVVYWGEGTKTLGLKPARRRELRRLIDRHTPPERRFRAMRGFLLRAMLDEMRPAALSRFLEERLRRRTPYVCGVGPRGRLAEDVKLLWTHYEAEPKAAMFIHLENVDAVAVDKITPGANVAVERCGLKLVFKELLAPGTIVAASLKTTGEGRARLIQCDWAEAEESPGKA